MSFVTKPLDSEDPVSNIRSTVIEAFNSWNFYLEVLNTLCTAGLKLSQNLNHLSQLQNVQPTTQLHTSWEELAKATVIATSTVKSHVSQLTQQYNLKETSTEPDYAKRAEINQKIILDNVATLISLQYQFSIASCETFSVMASCPTCLTTAGGIHDADCPMAVLQQCFAKFYNMSSTNSQFSDFDSVTGRSSSLSNPSVCFDTGQQRRPRSPLNLPLFPLIGQRRWSEVVTTSQLSKEGAPVSTLRRWSMPWDDGKNTQQQAEMDVEKFIKPKLVFSFSSLESLQNSSRPTTPELSQNPLITTDIGIFDAISLLSQKGTIIPNPQRPQEQQLPSQPNIVTTFLVPQPPPPKW